MKRLLILTLLFLCCLSCKRTSNKYLVYKYTEQIYADSLYTYRSRLPVFLAAPKFNYDINTRAERYKNKFIADINAISDSIIMIHPAQLTISDSILCANKKNIEVQLCYRTMINGVLYCKYDTLQFLIPH